MGYRGVIPLSYPPQGIPTAHRNGHRLNLFGQGFLFAQKRTAGEQIQINPAGNSRNISLIRILESDPGVPNWVIRGLLYSPLRHPEWVPGKGGIPEFPGVIGVRINGRYMAAEFLHCCQKGQRNRIDLLPVKAAKGLKIHGKAHIRPFSADCLDKEMCLLASLLLCPGSQVMIKPGFDPSRSCPLIVLFKPAVDTIRSNCTTNIYGLDSGSLCGRKINGTLPLTDIDSAVLFPLRLHSSYPIANYKTAQNTYST